MKIPGKPDAWKPARPVWSWAQGVIPWPITIMISKIFWKYFNMISIIADSPMWGKFFCLTGKAIMLKEITETWYTIERRDGTIDETRVKAEARLAIRERRPVTKNSRRIFSSGSSDIRLYVSTDIFDVKDLSSVFCRSTDCLVGRSTFPAATRKDAMSITSRNKRTPEFTSMDEMKRWQAEREDRLHSEHVRERMHRLADERETKKQQPAKVAKKTPK